MRLMRLLPAALLAALALAGGASAAGTHGFALFDVHTDLAPASHNAFGDVKVWRRRASLEQHVSIATFARCGDACTFGRGWLAFAPAPAFSAADVSGATAVRTKVGWSVRLTLTPRGWTSWRRFHLRAARSGAGRGVPDALVVVLNGTIVAQPLANQVRHVKTALEVPGLSRANARLAAKLLG
jgi:hypothetical protein